MPFSVSLWHKGGFYAHKGSIIGAGVSNVMIPQINNGLIREGVKVEKKSVIIITL